MSQQDDRDRAEDERAEPKGAEPERAERVPIGDPAPDEPDFADEHASATFADELSGGPEGVPESESPEGYAGMESRRLDRRRRPSDT
jgi:hypothetical protein